MVGTPLIQSRPAGGAATPFTCSDLGLCSIADLLFRAHNLLTGLGADDHAQYALLAGRAGGQTLIGGTAALDNLLLQSTAHATRGLITTVDPFRVGAFEEDGIGAAIGGDPQQKIGLRILRAPSANSDRWGAIVAQAGMDYTISAGSICGVGGKANIQSGRTAITKVYGLDFMAAHSGAHLAAEVTCIRVQPFLANASADATLVQGIDVLNIASIIAGADVTDAIAINVRNFTLFNHNYANTYGVKIAVPTRGTNRNILWCGDTTPLARVNAVTPAANQTALFLAEGVTPTERRVEWKLYSNLIAADRVMVLS
jgi:hypothetical protein